MKSRFMLLLVLSLVFTTNVLLQAAELALPTAFPGKWTSVGRTTIQTNADSVVVQGGYVTTRQSWSDMEISFRARAPLATEQVQIWGGLRQRDNESRYVFALRGGNNNDLYIARYAPDGGAKFLGFAPLDFSPKPGEWYRLRVVAIGHRFMIFLNDETLPRINVEDGSASWTEGGMCLGGGWLPAEFSDLQIKPLTSDDKAALLAIGEKRWAAPVVDQEAVRKKQRAAYQPRKIAALSPARTEFSLDGEWLFAPDHELASGPSPVQPGFSDENWHVMPVPAFWTPGLSWLHGDTSFAELDELSRTKGVAQSLYVQRVQECDAQTFDWRKTSSGWYRHHVDLPPDLGDRRFELSFDAVAKVSEVWVNGIKVGAHTGMFGRMQCDVTAAVKPGRNVVAVHVVSRPDSETESSAKVEGVAVTVEVTSAMLHSLPHGMFQEDVGGIWQSVRLVATAPVLVSDIFVAPELHGAGIDLDILNSRECPASLEVAYAITSAQDGTLLCSNDLASSVTVAAGETHSLKLTTPHVTPKLWSPQEPNLYNLEVSLKEQGEVVDRYTVRFGYRTFAVRDGKFFLNGQPYWLRGANPFPNTLRPNDAELARRFLQIAREGNINVTRSHIVPFTPVWLNAADEVGMAVSFEGTWPWLMLEGEPPSEELLQVWREEFLSLIRQYRNHPSLILWTVNNEMKFPELAQDNLPLLKKKWSILSGVIEDMRRTDPTRPIVADSAYVRKAAQKGYEAVVKPEGFDDGDVDDWHRYYGWYHPTSFFTLYEDEYAPLRTAERPLISQEMSTGYPNNDDGHPTRFYIFKHHSPQAFVGDDAYEHADPAIFLKRHAFMTKGQVEATRRTSHETNNGALLFSYFTWFQKPWLVDQIKPWPAYHALKTAMQPVLVSAELFGRHFYAGRTFRQRVCVVNDAEDCRAISSGRIVWEFRNGANVLSQGRVEVPAVDYDHVQWLDVDFTTPQRLPSDRVDGQLALRLVVDGKVLSENSYDVVLATPEWSRVGIDLARRIALWNPGKRAIAYLASLPITNVDSISMADASDLLLVGDLTGVAVPDTEKEQLKQFVVRGGRVLMLHPGEALAGLFPEQVKAFKAKQGEIVTMTMHAAGSPVFSGIDPLDLAWFERGGRQLPIACTGVYRIASGRSDTTAFAQQSDPHGYLAHSSDVVAFGGTPLVELRIGQGRLIASEMNFESGKDDPIARRLLSNLVNTLAEESHAHPSF